MYFRSLALANLVAALTSLRWQDFSQIREIVFLDNNTPDDEEQIVRVVSAFDFPVNVRMFIKKHGDLSKTHSWSTNEAVRHASSTRIFFTRADYILHRDIVSRFAQEDPNQFVTSNGYHLHVDVGETNASNWRTEGTDALRRLPGTEVSYTTVDAGVWMLPKSAFDLVGGLNNRLTAWGHAQTHFQHKLFKAGIEFTRIPEPLYFHPIHSADRDINEAHAQLAGEGISLREMWARHPGVY